MENPFKGHLCDDMSTGHLKGRIQCTEGSYFRQLSTQKINAFFSRWENVQGVL